jgi:phosphomannomutase/phosphoglucomutase
MRIAILGAGPAGLYLAYLIKRRQPDADVSVFEQNAANGGSLAGQKVRELITVNGVRIVLEDGTWGLVRASSNKPELVVVVESPTSEANMRAIFAEIDAELAKQPEVGAYNQKI